MQSQCQQKSPKTNKKLQTSKEEWDRLEKLTQFERRCRQSGYLQIAGIDEAGRGPIAGPVVAAACLLPASFLLPGIDDSKKLSETARNQLYLELTTSEEVVYSLQAVSPERIDQINIYQATIEAMLLAVKNLSTPPDYLLVDGLQLPHPTLPVEKIIRGDSLSQTIACASVLAKVFRDKLMEEYDTTWPEYGFARHKGYPTKAHCKALEDFGPCPIHRKTFGPVKKCYNEITLTK